MLSGEWVIRWFECLGGLSLFLQCLEYARLTPCTDPGGVWSWPVQRADIPDEPAWLKRLLDWLYQPPVYKAQLTVRVMAALALMVHGFPESWYSWRHQLPAIAAAGPVAAPLRPGRAWTAAYDIRLALPLGAFFLVFFLAPLALLLLVSFYADPAMTRFGLDQYFDQ